METSLLANPIATTLQPRIITVPDSFPQLMDSQIERFPADLVGREFNLEFDVYETKTTSEQTLWVRKGLLSELQA